MQVTLAIRHPKPGKEQPMFNTIQKSETAQMQHAGPITVSAPKDAGTGTLTGTALPGMSTYLDGATFDPSEFSPEGYGSSPVLRG